MSPLTENEFLRDVADHVLEVMRDDGVYRHIRFRKPGTMCMHFDLITWPGYLCYTGDMGTYVFARLADMFQFFRTDRSYAPRTGRRLAVNLSYWSEKLEAVDGSRNGGAAKEFSEKKLLRTINEYRVAWLREAYTDGSLDKEQRRELWEAVDEDVLRHRRRRRAGGLHSRTRLLLASPLRHTSPQWQILAFPRFLGKRPHRLHASFPLVLFRPCLGH